MGDPAPPATKEDPETLVLRANPKPVMRFKRPVLIAAAALGCATLFGVTWLGLGTPVPKAAERKELFNPDAAADRVKAKPEQLEALPASYADIPQLGPPLPGDLGGPMVAQQEAGTVVPAPLASGVVKETKAPSGVFVSVAKASSPSETLSSQPDPEESFSVTLANLTPPPLAPSRLAPAQSQQYASIYNSHAIETPVSPYQVMAGTVISASLVTGLKSDISGLVIAQVSAPVFDTVTGQILLIPQGTKLLGEYQSDLSFGQSRVLLIWNRLILPDGSSLEIDNFPGADTKGFSGLTDSVDYHTLSLLKGVGLSTLLGLTTYNGREDDSDLVRAFRDATRTSGNQAGQELVRRSMDIKPTITVRPGWPVRVIVQKDLILRPFEGRLNPWRN